ncbi:hypothetical protein V1512DRAFT_261072 [Lipomyces arxii]|uniref:uncharacterized protein n=1 Tax=Lipomyces arxii TaxID=56418 RepID=UPI0034CE6C6D
MNNVQSHHGTEPLRLTILPSEILTAVLAYLSPNDLFRLQLVSKYFNVLASSPTLWADLVEADEFSESEDYIARYKFINAKFRIRDIKRNRHVHDTWDNERARLVPSSKSRKLDDKYGIFGIDVLDESKGLIIGTTDDCTVRIWDINDSANSARVRNDQLEGVDMSDIKVDRAANRVWITADNILQEWDLHTLCKINQISFDKAVSAFSPDPEQSSSLYVSTQTSVHYIDTRTPGLPHASVASVPGYTLSLLASSFSSHSVSVSGRFPSILTYDRRHFPALLNSTYSGAHALASLLALPGRRGIVAAGEYNGRGTLEYYGNSDSSSSSWVNRYTVSRSSLLTLAQPKWTSEYIIAGSADGAVRCFDTARQGLCCREVVGPEHPSEAVMVSKILPINTATAAVLVDSKLKILDVDSPDQEDEDMLEPESDEDIMRREMYEHVSRAARREIYGMHNLNAFLVSF